MSKKISDQVKIGSVMTKNRIAVPPMVMFHWTDDNGYVTEKSRIHYGNMAKGGAGLIIGEATAITQRSRLHETELGLWEDGHIDGWKMLAEEVHKYDVPFFVQLLHAGVNGIDVQAETASDYTVAHPGRPVIYGHEISVSRIEETVDDFVKAAVRAQKAGLDGIELHGCHSYLLSQFMNKNLNKREDAYNAEDCKMPIDILKAIKQVCGDRFVAGIRLAAFEPDLAAGIAHAKKLEGVADFLDMSYGFFDGMDASKPDDFEFSPAMYGAQEVKKVISSIPVFGVDGIRNGEMAVKALEVTNLDMIDVGKGFLVNPNFGNCVLEGKPTGKCLECKPACKFSPHMNDGQGEFCAGRKLYAKEQNS